METKGEQPPLNVIEEEDAVEASLKPLDIKSQKLISEPSTQVPSYNSAIEPLPDPKIRHVHLSTFLSAVAFFIGFQLCLSPFSSQLVTLESMSYAFICELTKSNLCTTSKILCFGDSLIKMGVSPAILENVLNQPVCNLAVPGSRPSSSFFILRRVLQTGAAPQALLVDFESGILRDDPCVAVHESAEFFGLRDCLDLAVVTKRFDYVSSLIAAVTLPSYRHNYTIRSTLLKAFRLGAGIDRRSIDEYVLNWQNNKGQTLPPYSSHSEIEANNRIVWKEIIAKRVPWYCQSFNRVYLEKFIELANTHGITVYWLLPPMHPSAQQELEKSGVDSAYCKLAEDMLKRYPNLRIVDARHAHYGSTNFTGGCHLNRYGSMVFSLGLSKLLGPCLNNRISHRWLIMPRFQELEASTPLEKSQIRNAYSMASPAEREVLAKILK